MSCVDDYRKSDGIDETFDAENDCGDIENDEIKIKIIQKVDPRNAMKPKYAMGSKKIVEGTCLAAPQALYGSLAWTFDTAIWMDWI